MSEDRAALAQPGLGRLPGVFIDPDGHHWGRQRLCLGTCTTMAEPDSTEGRQGRHGLSFARCLLTCPQRENWPYTLSARGGRREVPVGDCEKCPWVTARG